MTVGPGRAFPLGATVADGGVNFSIFSRNAHAVELVLFGDVHAAKPARVVPLDAGTHRTYHYWHAFVPGLRAASTTDGRTVTAVAVDSRLPLERRLYDTTGDLWKTERWRISEVDGTPTVLGMSVHDEQTKTWTEIDVTSIRYDLALPSGLLEPSRLPDAAASPVWAQAEG